MCPTAVSADAVIFYPSVVTSSLSFLPATLKHFQKYIQHNRLQLFLNTFSLIIYFHRFFLSIIPSLPISIASFLSFLPLRTPFPKTIITSLVIQLTDRLMRQKKLNPTAQHRQIILSAKPALPLLEQCFHLHQSDHKHSAGKSWKEGKIEWNTCKKQSAASLVKRIFFNKCHKLLQVWINAKTEKVLGHNWHNHCIILSRYVASMSFFPKRAKSELENHHTTRGSTTCDAGTLESSRLSFFRHCPTAAKTNDSSCEAKTRGHIIWPLFKAVATSQTLSDPDPDHPGGEVALRGYQTEIC